ncbi:uncharacterized protein LOC124170998 [Ischnura elegans]|uniref:uncharacterized protein LOC124170998 n=1 Tax=Ischnura elegans TaxID=197161 RepID=UPI001ED8AA72|nr:uncharacterized protein LOC124170998 [Ischnura elegans]
MNLCSETYVNIAVALANGQVLTVDPSVEDHSKIQTKQVKATAKIKFWEAYKDLQVQSKAYRHESVVECLRRCPYADDMLLSVSSYSFCIWKEQSKLRRQKRKPKPSSKLWQYEETPSEEPQSCPWKVNILPVYWKRIVPQNFYYINGNWSASQTGQIYLLTSDGCVEIWNLEAEESSYAVSMKVGLDVANCVIPMMFSDRTDEVTYIEDELFYFYKIPNICKYENDSDPKYFLKLGNHEVWRRAKYYAFCLQYEQDNEESVQMKIALFEKFCKVRRKSRLTRAYDISRFIKAEERKKSVYDSIKWSGNFPAKWWADEKQWSVTNYLKKRNMPMLWEIERDRSRLITYKKKLEAHRIPKAEMMKDIGFVIEWEIYHIYNENFQLFWDLRQECSLEESTHLVESISQISDIDQRMQALQQKEISTRMIRMKSYESRFIFHEQYEFRRLQDVYKVDTRKATRKMGRDLTPVCKSEFTCYVTRLVMNDGISVSSEMDYGLQEAESLSPVNQALNLLEEYDFIHNV